ncbi:type VII secretion-associated serine protease mycosin [Kribbella orskensis]|uniref:Type VII secretion-associated serine protease mycosin n=1 Tax=Kribbella orskensis TaxID=2512216 RepID=A0ABY2BCM9_9ACTN|nr:MULTISPECIES: S8 family serine peptidase [Kribbella]TCN35223.1 type VII secretion-associated serine protease mycosin [Kribbella sp. VKM Ac-2500]TCO16645.1 type VII secretion-associated serine protease mycosin [Kribbella orskensis]
MRLRRTVLAASALVLLGSAIPLADAVQAAQKTPGTLAAEHLPRPERPRGAKEREFDAHSVLVRFKKAASAAAKDKALKSRGAAQTRGVRGTGYVEARTKGAAADLLRSLRQDSAVESVSFNYKRRIEAAPTDPAYTSGDQAYLSTVRVPQAWDRTKGSTSQVIAVVDTGVNGLHEDLTGRTVTGYDAINRVILSGASNSDQNGHGTMVAGIAAANTNNGLGVAGVAWTGRIMPVRVLGSDGSGLDSDIAAGITWAADHGAKVINLSLGGPGVSAVLHDAVKYATGKNVVVVVAAGNDGDDTPQYPAAYPEVVAVGATDSAGDLTDFSSWGDWIDVAAPGFGVVSAYQDSYAVGDGTSFAAPIVSGVAALVRTAFPSWTPAQVLARLRVTARDAGPRGVDPYYGYGVVDAYYAVGGAWAAEFPTPVLGAGEPNDVPARATTFSDSATGTLAAEGDIDWYRFDSANERSVDVRVTPAAFDADLGQNADPMLAVYDKDLRLIGEVDVASAGGAETLPFTTGVGTYYVAVRNYNGSADTRPYTLSVTTGTPDIFQPAVSHDVGSWPETVAVGDVTGDGRDDVLLTTSFYFDDANDYKLFVFAQTPSGALSEPVRYPTAMGYSGSGPALLDANGDGRQDVALPTASGVEIFHQTDAGLASAGVLPGTTGGGYVVAGDMDGDGDADLVLQGTQGITLLIHAPDGTFAASSVTADGSGEVEIGDVDGDGLPDVVTFTGGMVRVYHHATDGWNRTDHDTIRGYWPTVEGIEVADVNGDDRADVIASIGGNAPGSRINVFVQNASGGLDTPAVYLTRDIPEPVEAADITGDSLIDVVTAHGGWNTLSVLPQTAAGTLGTPVTSSIPYASHYNDQGLALGDINGDQRTDAVIADYNSGLVVLRNKLGPTPGGEQAWVRSVSPADFAAGLAIGTVPTVTFARSVDAASVTSSTVRLVNGRSGAAVAASVSYDATSQTARLTPSSLLQDNTPYRIIVSGVRDTSGATQAERFTSTFRTTDYTPGPVTNFKAAGALRGATLSWTIPSITDLDGVIVRRATGTTPPASPTSGDAVYAGTLSSITVSGLVDGTTYTFRVWVRDRSGKVSSPSTVTLRGTSVSISSNITALTYGGAVSVTGRLTRVDTGAAIPGAAVQLYIRRKGTTTWSLLRTATTSSTGYVSYSHKPSWSLDYEWIYRGSTAYIGDVTPLRTVSVRPVVAAKLSRTSFALGGSVVLSGTVTPVHGNYRVYLQRLSNGVWSTVTSQLLPSSSSYAFTLKPTSRATYTYRVYLPAHNDHLAGYSANLSFRVY